MPDGALSHLRVLDLSQTVAGAYATKLLADFGADVIKLEPPGTGDPLRRLGPFPNDEPHPERSGIFLHLNTNKRSVTLDPSTPTGRAVFLRLAANADIIVETFAPGSMASWGLGYADLEALNRRLILVSITPFGQSGPYKSYQGTDLTEFAAGLRMYRYGEPDREPLRYAPHQSEYHAACYAAAATMSAVVGARLQGEGQHVDVSIQETWVGAVDSMVLRYEYTGAKNGRLGHVSAWYPSGIYPCADGFFQIQVSSDRHLARLGPALGMGNLLADPRFATAEARAANRDEFEADFYLWASERTKVEAAQMGQRLRVFSGPANTVADLFDDPQYQHRGFFQEVDHPATGPLRYPGAPFRMEKTPWRKGRAPLLAEHNADVLCGQCGYSTEQVVRLRGLGVI
ncbi:MAG: CoA transferase [Chloroflexi bacterium]|nr:CoA transferase [Chloroflexota bacterium]